MQHDMERALRAWQSARFRGNHRKNEAKAPRRARRRTHSARVFTRIAQRLLVMAAYI
jgi:hypothetical protein